MAEAIRSIEHIVETLKHGKENGYQCSMLIGAGCSVSAGIPTANGFIEYIKEKFSLIYQDTKSPTYSNLMSKLGEGERKAIVDKFVDQAKVNWAHVAMAQLLKCNYVDRILTTNFDPLIVRAAAMIGLFPAIYDVASSAHLYKPHFIPNQAVFHLHGQRSGLKLMNTEEEVNSVKESLGSVFQDAGQG